MTLRQSLPSRAQVWGNKASEWHVQCHSVLGKSAFPGETGILLYQVAKLNLKKNIIRPEDTVFRCEATGTGYNSISLF